MKRDDVFWDMAFVIVTILIGLLTGASMCASETWEDPEIAGVE